MFSVGYLVWPNFSLAVDENFSPGLWRLKWQFTNAKVPMIQHKNLKLNVSKLWNEWKPYTVSFKFTW